MRKRLGLIGEGQGDVDALPTLVSKLLKDKNATDSFFVDKAVIRAHNPSGLIKSRDGKIECANWLRFLEIAKRRPNLAGVLAVFDGDADYFPAGSKNPFCPASAGKELARYAAQAGAGTIFSLAVAFAIKEFESWLAAGAESLKGKFYTDGRPILRTNAEFGSAHSENRGKKWFEINSPGYRPTLHQKALAESVEIDSIRAKNVRSFSRLENTLNQILTASGTEAFICTPGT